MGTRLQCDRLQKVNFVFVLYQLSIDTAGISARECNQLLKAIGDYDACFFHC